MSDESTDFGAMREELAEAREAIASLTESMDGVSEMLDQLNGHTVEVHELNRKRAEWIPLLDGGPGQGFAFYIELPCPELRYPKRSLTLNDVQASAQQEQKARGEFGVKNYLVYGFFFRSSGAIYHKTGLVWSISEATMLASEWLKTHRESGYDETQPKAV